MKGRATIERVEAAAYRVPTDKPESDGTYCWLSTTLVTTHVYSQGLRGFGYSYADPAAAALATGKLAPVLAGLGVMDLPHCWKVMLESVRNLGEPGVAMLAVSALDAALWDLKGKLLDLALIDLLGAARTEIPVYGSGGFTSYGTAELQRQLADWVGAGIPRVKMKIGTDPKRDPDRVRAAREAVGGEAELFVDANGAYEPKQALALAELFAEQGVSWFEEPVTHQDLAGLRRVRDRAPSCMEIAAGEYGFTLGYFDRMLEAGAVDVLQADASRCGITGFLRAATLCEGRHLSLSAHCAPSLHLHPCCAAGAVRHLEYFHDHVRIERLLFDGFVEPVAGGMAPDRGRPGLGIELRESEARRYRV